jgi:autotransporter-associated beta strand protein
LVFSCSGYTLSDGTLTLASADGMPAITVGDNTTQTILSTIAGDQGLLKEGPGTLVLAGTNSYSGDTLVAGGTLIAANVEALADGANITVGDAAAFAAADAPSAASAAAALRSVAAGLPTEPLGAITPVPEPGTIALLAAGAMLLAICKRRQRSKTTHARTPV